MEDTARLFAAIGVSIRVNVRDYTRIRLGRTEHVCAHTRKWPDRQLSFAL